MIKLKEFVPIDRAGDVHAGLKKHGVDTFANGTFGVEFELSTEEIPDESMIYDALSKFDNSQIYKAISRSTTSDQDKRLSSDYDDWLTRSREQDNRYGFSRRGGKASDWDDSHGPIDFGTWSEHNPEPEIGDFDDEDEFRYAHTTWKYEAQDVEYDYSRWERSGRNDYFDEFISEIVQNQQLGDYVNIFEVASYLGITGDQLNINSIKSEISEFLSERKQKINQNESGTKDGWGVGEDGPNIEIRSRHLRRDDFDLLTSFMNFLKTSGYEVTGGTSAHVHVGLPKNFDYFDLFCMMTLVDEKALVGDEGPGRLFSEWAKLRDDVVTYFEKVLSSNPDFTIGWEDVFEKDKMHNFIRGVFKKYSGTNISSFFQHGTVEFRYFSSRMIAKPSTFLRWIEYFMLLPNVAMKRNKFEFAGYTFIRHGNNEVKIVKGKKASTSNRPANDLKASIDGPQLSKMDQKEKQILKYLDVYEKKAKDVGGEEKLNKKDAEILEKLRKAWSDIDKKYNLSN